MSAGPACARSLNGGSAFAPAVKPGGFDLFSRGGDLVIYPRPGKVAVFEKPGILSPAGRYLDAITRNSSHFRSHLQWVLSAASGNWENIEAPYFSGAAMINQSPIHRMVKTIGSYRKLMAGADVPAPFKQGLLTDAWVANAEQGFAEMVNADGLLQSGSNVCDMAQSLHLLRTGLEAGGLRPARIWTLPRAQGLIRAILTKRHIIHPKDEWLRASPQYLERCREKNAKIREDEIRIRDGQVFFTGGLFIGWKPERPSCHGAWAALSILNTQYKQYGPAVFASWRQLRSSDKEIARETLATLRRRLWLDYKEKRGPCYCHIVDGKPAKDLGRPSQVPMLPDNAAYSRGEQAGWASLCYDEIFGTPSPNSNAGVRNLLTALRI